MKIHYRESVKNFGGTLYISIPKKLIPKKSDLESGDIVDIDLEKSD